MYLTSIWDSCRTEADDGVKDVDFETVLGQGHTDAARAVGNAERQAFEVDSFSFNFTWLQQAMLQLRINLLHDNR